MRRLLLVALCVAATACARFQGPNERAMEYLEAVRDSAWDEVAERSDSAGLARARTAHASARALIEAAVRDGTFREESPIVTGPRAQVLVDVPCTPFDALLNITMVQTDGVWIVTYLGTNVQDCEAP